MKKHNHAAVRQRHIKVSIADLTLKGHNRGTIKPDQPVNGSSNEINDEIEMDGLQGRSAEEPVHDGRRQAGVGDEDAERDRTPRDPDERISGPDSSIDLAPTMVLSVPARGVPSTRAPVDDDWPAEDVSVVDWRPDPSVGLASLGFIRKTLRRRVRVWGAIALIGLLAGAGYLKERPPAQSAIVTLLLASPPGSLAGQAILDDQAYVQSYPIAAQALRRLKSNESAVVFLRHYAATVVTNSVLSITVKSTSSADAVAEANALATAFLSFQTNLLTTQTKQENTQYDAAIAEAQQSVEALKTAVQNLESSGGATSDPAELKSLKTQLARATTKLTITNQTLLGDEATNAAANAAVIIGSKVLTPAVPVPPSTKKDVALYVGGGLIAGLVVGMGSVAVGALVSDRLRRRDDVARILGVPVRLSVGRIVVRRWLPGRRGLGLAKNRNVQLIVEHLHNVVRHSTGLPSLALVPVDDVEIPAACLTTLALSCAHLGLRVVLADLCPGAPAARLLQIREAGVHTVRTEGSHLTVAVPDTDEVHPVGPLLKSPRGRVPKPLSNAYATADMFLTLAPLDPAFGAEHLSEWATSLVAMVTAGTSSAARIAAVGEMIHQTGIDSASAVLVDADKGDESLGSNA